MRFKGLRVFQIEKSTLLEQYLTASKLKKLCGILSGTRVRGYSWAHTPFVYCHSAYYLRLTNLKLTVGFFTL